MTNSIHSIIKLAALALLTLPLLLSSPLYAQGAGSPQLNKLAKKFNVSPGTLAKFSDMNIDDIKSGLDMANKLSNKGDLSMDAAVDKVMSAAADGQDWSSIASDFDIDAADVNIPSSMPTKLKKKLPN
jgi:hypothetical protein